MNEDKIINKLLEHDEKLARMVIKEELQTFRDEVSSSNDEMLTILKRLDEERHFTAAWIQRVEEELKIAKKVVGRHEIELSAVKKRLAIL
jgi:predicted RND superfamily exporter protein